MEIRFDPAHSACFTGHRQLSEQELRDASLAVSRAVEALAAQGITHYYAGGALGFDLAAAVTVLNLKTGMPFLSLTLALPCREHMAKWRRADRELFSRVMARADRVLYVSDDYFSGCMQKRNRFMVDGSSVCLAYMTACRGGTFHTVSYARKKGISVMNLAENAVGGRPQADLPGKRCE